MEVIDFDTVAGFRRAVLASVQAALARSTRTLLCADPDFADWPLDDPVLLDALGGHLRRPGRRLILLAGHFDGMQRWHPRFSQWRSAWSHAIEPRSPELPLPDGLHALMLDDGPTVLEALSREPLRGRAQQNSAVAAAARDRIDACLQRSAPNWPLRPLGL